MCPGAGSLLISVETFTGAADHPETRVVRAEGEICLTFQQEQESGNFVIRSLSLKRRTKTESIQARNLQTPKFYISDFGISNPPKT